MIVNPGIFNKKIKIISRVISKDSDGFPMYQEKVIISAWAQVTNISGTQLQKSNSDFSEVKTRFFMRTPKPQIDHSWIIKFHSKYYNIIYINDYYHDGLYTEIIAKLVEK